ncbi:MAG: methyl-accepting chemotaxis protein, partial [Mariprofundaceae bacterium]
SLKATLMLSFAVSIGTIVLLASMLLNLNVDLSEAYQYTIIVAAGFSVLLSALFVMKVRKPLREIVEGMQRLVEGDYSIMPVKYSHDELGDVADDMKTMQSLMQYEIFEGKAMAVARVQEQRQAEQDKLLVQNEMATAFEEKVGSLVTSLAEESLQVSREAKDLDHVADSLISQSDTTLEAVHVGGSHVNSTAAAIEEMSVTISDVSQQVSNTQGMSDQAVKESASATSTMHRLTSLANEIGSIVGAISDIAEQTNLLALNASIEAARAGDAGRGFSVVAGEVKELANQTSQATAKIREQVEGIQKESQEAMLAINRTSETIQEINDFSATVTEAMQQQALAGREISNAAQQADMSMNEAKSSTESLQEYATAVDKSSDDMIVVADSMVDRIEEVQKGIHNFVEGLRSKP